VLAELERTELEESERAESQQAETQKSEAHKESPEPVKAAPDKPAAESTGPVFSSHQQSRQKARGPLVALLMLTLAGAGFYAAWTYQPGFQAIVQPQVDRMLALVGMTLTPASTPIPAKPSVPIAAKAPAPASATPTVPAQPSAATATAVAPPTSGATTAPVVSNNKNDNKNNNQRDSKKDVAAISSNAPLPGENSAIILSSKGAENRLAHSVPPKYPAEAHAEGTVVLKTVVDETGRVEGVRLVEGNATLAAAAIEAVKQWRYRPYVRDGKALPFQTVVIVDFQRP